MFSEHATGVELCLFDAAGAQTIHAMSARKDHVWRVRVPDIGPGQRYGFRALGPWQPDQGHRFNPAKLLLDPYTRAVDDTLTWDDALFGHAGGDDLVIDGRDSAPFMPKSVVIDANFDWEDDHPPAVPWHDTIIYEAHVRGFTARNPRIPRGLRASFAGLAAPGAIEHFRSLGITAVELMPVHYFVAERHLVDRGVTNYWGYNSIGYFAPHTKYASPAGRADPVREFKTMVKALHRAGIEVILDVVYNHTAEGNHHGPMLCFRGLDNASYYRLAEDRRYYKDYTGCGNTLDMTHPRSLQLLTDSLRYWILDMHVDGFRFDLAAALARELDDVHKLGAFFDAIHADPVISQVKLIAEPWDLGPNGYHVGNFPERWAEWNGVYRDTVRAFWKGDEGQIGSLAHRITGSSDLYGFGGRRPFASINFVTAHDGFTLRDLVSYDTKHNEANGDNNTDGTDHNLSWNCGAEGPTDDIGINALRARQQRNFLATLLVSQGVPMLTSGDELGRTQHGNNNAYCQDNEISWLDWKLDAQHRETLAFARRVVDLRRRHPTLRRHQFLQGRHLLGSEVKDLAWFRPDGQEMTEGDWHSYGRCLGLRYAGDAIDDTDAAGASIVDDTLLILLNAYHEPIDFILPAHRARLRWKVLVDTRDAKPRRQHAIRGGAPYPLEARSMAILVLATRPRERRTRRTNVATEAAP